MKNDSGCAKGCRVKTEYIMLSSVAWCNVFWNKCIWVSASLLSSGFECLNCHLRVRMGFCLLIWLCWGLINVQVLRAPKNLGWYSLTKSGYCWWGAVHYITIEWPCSALCFPQTVFCSFWQASRRKMVHSAPFGLPGGCVMKIFPKYSPLWPNLPSTNRASKTASEPDSGAPECDFRPSRQKCWWHHHDGYMVRWMTWHDDVSMLTSACTDGDMAGTVGTQWQDTWQGAMQVDDWTCDWTGEWREWVTSLSRRWW